MSCADGNQVMSVGGAVPYILGKSSTHIPVHTNLYLMRADDGSRCYQRRFRCTCAGCDSRTDHSFWKGMATRVLQRIWESEHLLHQINFAIQFLYIFSVAPVKISVLLFYRRIFGTRKFGVTLMIVGVCVIMWAIAFFFATLFQAWPISYNWTGVGKPTDYTLLYWIIAGSDIFLDLITVVLPVPMIWGLQMSQRRKWIVTGIFGLGGL